MFRVRVVKAPGTFVNCVGMLELKGRYFRLVGTRSYTTSSGSEVSAEVGVASYIVGETTIDNDTIHFSDDEGSYWQFEILEDEEKEKDDEQREIP